MTSDRDALAKVLYETQEQLRADDDIPGSPWVPWEKQTSRRERRIAYAMADAALAALARRREDGVASQDADFVGLPLPTLRAESTAHATPPPPPSDAAGQ